MTPMMAARAYGDAIRQTAQMGADEPTAAKGADFGKMVQSALEQTYQSTKAAEQTMIAHTEGRAELIDAVTAVSSAETSLQSVIAIRDQVISAYQEIMRMPI